MLDGVEVVRSTFVKHACLHYAVNLGGRVWNLLSFSNQSVGFIVGEMFVFASKNIGKHNFGNRGKYASTSAIASCYVYHRDKL